VNRSSEEGQTTLRAARPPRPVPVVPRGRFGSVLDFARDPLRTIAHAASFGDVVRLRMAHNNLYLVNTPDGVKQVLQDNAHNYSRERNQGVRMLRPILGAGVLTSDGPVWRARRKAAQRAFGEEQLAAMTAEMKDEALQALASASRSEPVDVYRFSLKVAIATTLRAMFGYRPAPDEREDLYHAILEGQHAAWSNLVVPFQVPRWLPTPLGVLRGRRVLRVVDALAQRVVEARRALAEPRGDYLDGILDTCSSDRDIRDEVVTMMTAAPENMAYTLSMALYLVAGHPSVEATLREEIERVLGRRQPAASDLPRLSYTGCVLKETLRLHPGAYLYDRWAIHEDMVGGYHIPAGSYVVVSPYTMHRRPDLWPDPDRFDPGRFSTAVERPRFAYFPFGGGPHRCIGEHFALLQLTLLLPLIIQAVRLERVGARPVDLQAMITVRPRAGVWMKLAPPEAPGPPATDAREPLAS